MTLLEFLWVKKQNRIHFWYVKKNLSQLKSKHLLSFIRATQTRPRQSHGQEKKVEARRTKRRISRQKTKRQFLCKTSRLKAVQVRPAYYYFKVLYMDLIYMIYYIAYIVIFL